MKIRNNTIMLSSHSPLYIYIFSLGKIHEFSIKTFSQKVQCMHPCIYGSIFMKSYRKKYLLKVIISLNKSQNIKKLIFNFTLRIKLLYLQESQTYLSLILNFN